MDKVSTVESSLDNTIIWKRHIEELCEGSTIRSGFCTAQYVEPVEVDAFAVNNSPLDPQRPCQICPIRTVQLFYIEPDAALSVKFNTWRADTPKGLAHMAAVFNSAALTEDEKVTWYHGDRTLPPGVDPDQWIDRSLRAFLELCPHRRHALKQAAYYPMVYSEEQPVNITTDLVARDYEHLAMESSQRTVITRNRIIVCGGSNAKGLAHALGKDAQFVEADTSEVLVARAAKLFPSRMTRLAILWPQAQPNYAGLLEVARRAAARLREFKQLQVLLLAPVTKETHDFRYASMLHQLDNTPGLPAIGASLVTLVTGNKERSFMNNCDLRPACIEAVAELCAHVVKDTLGMAIREHQSQAASGGHGPERRGRKRAAVPDSIGHRVGRLQSPPKKRLASQIQRAPGRSDDAGPSSSSTRRK